MAADEIAQNDDALFVLTAAMLTPGQFPGVLGDDYPTACAGLGLEPLGAGYGLVFGQDGTGARWTVATTDAAMVACALAAWDCGLEYDLSPDEESMAASLPGWPLPIAVAVPGIPEPFDPDEETAGRPALTPPDTSVWGPAQRRLGADEIAIHWREWRDQFAALEEPDEPSGGRETAPEGGPGAAPAKSAPAEDPAAEDPAATDRAADAPAATDRAAKDGPGKDEPGDDEPAKAAETEPAPDPPAETGSEPRTPVRRALAAAEAYLREPPPPGRVRTTYGAVRADGPGWSLVARTDDMAFLLLDAMPGEVLPVGRGPSLPPLLEALGRLAGAETVTSS
ncbi:hypothetical protein [Streptomyces sp. NBC_01476]|uniref:hypothetical protein n=1 Tax=Streptomyces sp. NBC_01476 TaxID=2903881 RepID=UPI003FCDD6F2